MLRLLPKLLLALLSAALLSSAFAQRAPSELMPDTTVLAFEVTSGQFDPTVIHNLFTDLNSEGAKQVWRQYADLFALLADAPPVESFEGEFDWRQMKDEFLEKCPALWDVLQDASQRDWAAGFAVTMSRYDPEPDMLFVASPATRTLSARLLAGLVSCFDGRHYASEGDSNIYLFSDGSELPLLVAESGGAIVAASDPDLLRGAIRRATGSGEASFADTRIGGFVSSVQPAGLTMTVNLAAVADALAVFRGAVPPEAEQLFDRVVTTLRVVNGWVFGVGLDADALTVTTVSAFDGALAEIAGERDLLNMLTCAECTVERAPHPLDAVAVAASAYPVNATVAWLDSWLADVKAAGVSAEAEEFTVRSLFRDITRVDLDVALLDWLEGSYFTYVMGVYDTDASNWIMGLPSVTAFKVTSEEAAWQGVNAWVDVARFLSAFTGAMGSTGSVFDTALNFDQSVSVRQLNYGGVDYLRVRAAPNMDLGVAVFDGHLVIGSPVKSLLDAINQGGVTGTSAMRVGPLSPLHHAASGLENVTGRLVGYSIVDPGAFINGVARIAELASGPVATGLWLASYGMLDEAFKAGTADGLNVPSYDDALVLTDFFVQALELLATKLDASVGVVTVDGDVWRSQWRLPLAQ